MCYFGRRSAAANKFITTLTQGSQSLALGLVLTAASQLVGVRPLTLWLRVIESMNQ